MASNSQPSGGLSGTLRATLSCAVALAVGVGAIYALGPWSTETAGPPAPPRPVGAAVEVAGRTVSVLGAGDILLHPELWDQARRDGGGELDFGPMLAPVRETVSSADLALCHLETALAPPGGPYIGFPKFSVPQEVLKGIKSVGYDGCSTASNHTIDQGYDGVKRTLDALDKAGLGHTGSYRTEREAGTVKIYRAKGVKIGHISFTKSFNGLRAPAGKEWVANLIDVKAIRRDAAAARDAGAEIVVVSLHWGTEYEHEPDVDQQTWARQIAAIDDVDVVFGHHAHVVQPVERIGDTWIVYGMGNQIARHAEPINANRDGAMTRVTFGPAGETRRWKVVAIEAIPTFVDLNPNIRLVDLERAMADPALSPGRRRIYEAAVERIEGNLLTRAAGTAGLVVRGVPRR
ncbi:poly-gamma-glutamate biosynthesis protein [Micromonospora inaquosa]|uniref:Poly-gamma-glutamate biosynthesis protein n=1 Tax=Micromonospora inaquosa TaxID=2203716 RepID=A0A3N9W3C9_9ACTN|nr:poly-gamma-glutamate biosynthesis protein [Micromonospora inaquosa]